MKWLLEIHYKHKHLGSTPLDIPNPSTVWFTSIDGTLHPEEAENEEQAKEKGRAWAKGQKLKDYKEIKIRAVPYDSPEADELRKFYSV
jgi:hypothetical protein